MICTGHTIYKQTRYDTSVRKQIVALLFSAQQIHGNAADKSRGRNEPWRLHFSMPIADIWHTQTYVTIRGLRGCLPSDKCICPDKCDACKDNARKRICTSKFSACKDTPITAIPNTYVLSTWSQDLDFQDPGFLFSESNYPRSWLGKQRIVISIYATCKAWNNLCKHWNVISTCKAFKAWSNLCKHRIVGTQFFLLGIFTLRPISKERKWYHEKTNPGRVSAYW